MTGRAPNHRLMDVTPGMPRPAIERLIDGVLWPCHLLVCHHCFQVEIHSFNPGKELEADDTAAHIVIVNPGNEEMMSLCQAEPVS